MPTKYKPSILKIDRNTKKTTIEHFYVKSLSVEKLFEMLNNSTTKPKNKQKFRNELVRRGVKIVKVPAQESNP